MWYEKAVDYYLTVVAGETWYTSGNWIKASFTVRRPDPESPWRIVSWRDDVGGGSHWAELLGRMIAEKGADKLWPFRTAS